MASYKSLIVWQKACNLSLEIYKATKNFPKEEAYRLTNQLRRASVSVPSNIAEGNVRNGTKEYLQFLYIARGSCAEIETQIFIAKELKYIESEMHKQIQEHVEEVLKILNAIIKKLS